jgi:hypothetical protein
VRLSDLAPPRAVQLTAPTAAALHRRSLGGLWAVRGRPRPTNNDRSPWHLHWSEPWASSCLLVNQQADQYTG